MRLPRLPEITAPGAELPLWPPLLATRGPGGLSRLHAHHAMHFALAADGELRARAVGEQGWQSCAGLLTAPDLPHAIDARGRDVLLVFLDPESEVGRALAGALNGTLRTLADRERTELLRDAEPLALMRSEVGAAWCRRALELLGGQPAERPTAVHPRVRRLLRLLTTGGAADSSLEALADRVGLSPGRLMHVFTESIGIPLRPYIAWLKLQRAAGAIASGQPLAVAAQAAGFVARQTCRATASRSRWSPAWNADASHMTRTFRRMLGALPSELRPR